MMRFIDGRSSSEISSSINNGISERHVSRLSNMALEIFPVIHEENTGKLGSAMKSYILQIDGTVDSEFSMIVVVRDAISDFVLHARRCDSESHESMKSVLQEVKNKFGVPSGITSDMRAGIISAASEVFPGVPIRLCLMHFLRDLGKDLMSRLHTDLGLMINRIGTKSPLKAILKGMPDYNQKTLDEIDNGFCSDRREMEIMAIRKVLEKLTGFAGSSGYGFPFSLRHYNFYLACLAAKRKLSRLSERIKSEKAKGYASMIDKLVSSITDNDSIRDMGRRLGSINGIFQSLRKAFSIPKNGNLSQEMPDDDRIHEKCNLVIDHMKVYLHAGIPDYINSAVKIIIDRYNKRESMLFANNPEHTIRRTNNGMERFFRKMRRNVRKRTGNTAAGNILAQSGEHLALFQNIGNPEYVRIVFGSEDIAKVFARYRKPFRKPGMTVKRKLELADKGTEMLMGDSLPDTPFTDEMMEEAYKLRRMEKGSTCLCPP